jgi:hypothetical protein
VANRAIPPAAGGVKEECLDAAFDEMQKRYAMVEKYFSDGLASMPKPGNLETSRHLCLARR